MILMKYMHLFPCIYNFIIYSLKQTCQALRNIPYLLTYIFTLDSTDVRKSTMLNVINTNMESMKIDLFSWSVDTIEICRKTLSNMRILAFLLLVSGSLALPKVSPNITQNLKNIQQDALYRNLKVVLHAEMLQEPYILIGHLLK